MDVTPQDLVKHVEAYVVSWIEMGIHGTADNTGWSRLMLPRGLKYVIPYKAITFHAVEAYVASWIEIHFAFFPSN